MKRLWWLVFVTLAGCVTSSPTRTPVVALDVPEAFRTELRILHFTKGENIVDHGFLEMKALAYLTRYEGYWGERTEYDSTRHSSWWIDIYSEGSPRVAAAFATAKDGYEANLDEWSNFISPVSESGRIQPLSYLFARFQRKHFGWGDAVSFLSQGTQDTGIYVPCNHQFLTYEVWGVTKDGRHTVVLHTAVSNPQLEECRDVRTMEALKSDPAYKLIESCSPDDFQPSLATVDAFVGSLQMK